ncbi:long-chain-fatty-acid--CoA ligase [Alicycliphilus denitrificans]|uniref:AMP-dependent synthetase/ligase n=1 Tax=Alicycliphilus denitrificans TaxID=179636 RepID=UPI0009643FB3|nr:AMP-binding protein [Alicycliphilus denitrificans]MBN9572658.1 AMP-binding protein [Alicycliphilus denitrificans]OJW92639.1 MAG: long-chain fatty acid--CoA ligase [Alicycliphilus sp. 69-12]BCN37245.1 long-chain-fatty-acid--CoA ligase [Alicycliphilus denitrificans]
MTTTFPQLLLQHAAQRPDAPALREKEYGIWQTWSWKAAAAEVRLMACGLLSLGFAKGQNLALISDNRPHVYMGFIAVQSIGGVPIPLYQDAVASEMRFVMEDAEIHFAFAENQEQVDKLLEVRESVSGITHIIYDDPRGLRNYDQPGLISTADLMARGSEWDRAHPGVWESMVGQISPQDVSVILYTSGTTGKPKGVCQTHASFIGAASGAAEVDRLGPQDSIISYLPPAWVGDHLFSLAQWLVAGYTINCPESAGTVSIDMREIGPTYYFAPPRVFEGMLTSISIRMEDAAPFKRRMYEKAMELARRVGSDILDGKPVGALDRLKYRLADFAVYGPLRNVMGLSRIRVAYTAGAAIGPELFRFFRSIGINLKQFYGQTETCAYVCLQRDGQVDLNSVGQAAPGIELKLADNGEVLVKGVAVLKEYYKRPDATAEVIDASGYFHTGDAGVIDANGQLRIIDRAKDVGKMKSGAMFAPNYIENKLKFFSHIKEAVCFGHDRDQVCAFINIDFEAVGNWAERQNLPYAGYVDLASKAKVLELVADCVAQVNADLARESGMADTQVARFLVLHKELDPDDDELTRTRKVRRNFIAEKYGVLIDALYAGKGEQFIETQVKFEDGRTGTVSATLKIIDAKTYPASAAA